MAGWEESPIARIPGFNIPSFDKIEAAYPNTTTEVYTYSLAGDTVAILTVVYTDLNKDLITSVVKS